MQAKKSRSPTASKLVKVPTGIKGFDDIMMGGLPGGRSTLVAGGAGSGKTMFGMEFIVHGATEFNEPGIYVSFEENIDDLKKNFASMNFDLTRLIDEKKIIIDHVFIERNMIEETGEYDLEALFIRLGYEIDSIGAKRVALDTIEVLFSGLTNHAVIRAEILRLFRWLKDRGVTTIVTGERGQFTLTRYGLEEYIADCVILLDNRIDNELSTRRLRIIKYRGSSHGTGEYPFLIGKAGITIFPITSIRTDYKMSMQTVSTGMPIMDEMLDGKGYFKGSTVLVSGTAGTGKTSLGAHFVDAACRRGEKCLYISLEENQGQVVRNMRSIGINLQQWIDKGRLKFHVARPAMHGIEMHLLMMEDEANRFKPQNILIDPITDFTMVGGGREVKSMLIRLIDLFKARGITIMMTELIRGDIRVEKPETYISSLIDTWILLRNFEYGGERCRGLTILKSRGMAHSNQIREFVMSSDGIKLLSPYIGPEGVFMGSIKLSQEAKDNARILNIKREIQHKHDMLEEKMLEYEAKMLAVKTQQKVEESDLKKGLAMAEQDLQILLGDREQLSRERKMKAQRP
ncbi:MAG TPA: circadian clock protein KaiC [Methanocella sp.]|nr:circadian clock protein KaiC [Methanocella sp.]